MRSSEDSGHFCLHHLFMESPCFMGPSYVVGHHLGHRRLSGIWGLIRPHPAFGQMRRQWLFHSSCAEKTPGPHWSGQYTLSPLPFFSLWGFGVLPALASESKECAKGPLCLPAKFPHPQISSLFYSKEKWVVVSEGGSRSGFFPKLGQSSWQVPPGPSGSVPWAVRNIHSWRASHPSWGLGQATWVPLASWPAARFNSEGVRALRKQGTQMTCLQALHTCSAGSAISSATAVILSYLLRLVHMDSPSPIPQPSIACGIS